VALVGLRGAGKSTLGPVLARELEAPFVELDDRVERLAGLTLGELFDLHGPEAYRRFAAEALEQVLAEGERYEAAAGHIGRAAELMPERARVQYNLGLALERIGRDAEAGRALEQAARLAPGDPEIVYALALHLVERGQWSAAREPTRRLVELTRSAPQALELWRRVEAHPEAATVRE